jgi:hypothetical protein
MKTVKRPIPQQYVLVKVVGMVASYVILATGGALVCLSLGYFNDGEPLGGQGAKYTCALGAMILMSGVHLYKWSTFVPDVKLKHAQARWEKVSTSDDVLVRPAGPVEEDQLLHVPGNAEAESDQLLRASEEGKQN